MATVFKPKYDLDPKNIVVWQSIVDEERVIPNEAPFEVFLEYIPHQSSPSTVLASYFFGGSLTEVVDEPTEIGTFRVAYRDYSGRVSFSPLDAGKSVLISYEAIGSVLRAADINAIQDVVSLSEAAIDAHLVDVENPHNVTLEQLDAVSRAGDEMLGPFVTQDIMVKSGYSIIPEVALGSSLGTEEKPFSSVYVGPGSLYIDGVQVISSTVSTLSITTDADQHLAVSTSGLGTTRLASAKEVFLWSGQDINIQSLNNLNVLTGGQMEFSVDAEGQGILFETKSNLGQINFRSVKAVNFDSPSVTFTHHPTVMGDPVLTEPYVHPETHPATIIAQDSSHRFVSDVQISKWDAKQDVLGYIPEDVANKGQASGYASLDTNAKIPLSQIPDTARQQTYIVADPIEREVLTGLLAGDKCYETTTGDSFIYDGLQWLILADADWANVNIDWANIIGKPDYTTRWPSWVEVIDKPASFNPSAHKVTHATGGMDEILPSDIGAETPVGAQEKVDAHESKPSPHSGHELTSNKGQPGGYASLDATGNIPVTQLNNVDAMEMHGNEWHSEDFETITGAQAKVDTHASDVSNVHQVTAAQTGALVSIDGVDNAGGNIDLVAGTGVTITPDNILKQITIEATGDMSPGAHASSHAIGGDDPITPASIGAETPADAQAKVDTHEVKVASAEGLGHVQVDGTTITISPEGIISAGDTTPDVHASTHAIGGSDLLTPEDIGAPSLDANGAIILGGFRIGYNAELGTLDFYGVV